MSSESPPKRARVDPHRLDVSPEMMEEYTGYLFTSKVPQPSRESVVPMSEVFRFPPVDEEAIRWLGTYIPPCEFADPAPYVLALFINEDGYTHHDGEIHAIVASTERPSAFFLAVQDMARFVKATQVQLCFSDTPPPIRPPIAHAGYYCASFVPYAKQCEVDRAVGDINAACKKEGRELFNPIQLYIAAARLLGVFSVEHFLSGRIDPNTVTVNNDALKVYLDRARVFNVTIPRAQRPESKEDWAVVDRALDAIDAARK